MKAPIFTTMKEVAEQKDRETKNKTLSDDQYVKVITRIREETMNLVKITWPKDKQVISNVADLLTTLETTSKDANFALDLWGFMQWAGGKESRSSVLATIVHDLAEFANNRHQKWFAPRTGGYSKYLSGASGVIHW